MNTTQQPSLRFYLLSVVCLGILFLVGCSDKAALESVDYVLHNAQQEPVEALERIRSIDKSSIRGKHNRARYALAYSEALYYNRINSDCDTLVRPLFEYYHDSDNHEERARAMFQYGWTMNYCHRISDAMYALLEADKSLNKYNNLRLSGIVSRTIGDIYGNQCLYGECLNAYYKAKECFDAANLGYHSLHILYEIGSVHSRMHNFNEAIKVLTKAKELAALPEFANIHFEIVCELCFVYLQIKDFESCIELFESLNLEYKTDSSIFYYHCLDAIIHAYNGNFLEAELSVSKAKECNSILPIYIDYTEYWLHILRNDTQQALLSYQQMINVQDDAFHNLIDNSVSQDVANYLEENVIKIQKLNKNTKIITLLIVLLFTVFILFIIYIFYVNNKRKQARISTLLEQLESVKQDVSSKTNRIKHLSNIALEKENELSTMRRQLNDNIFHSLQYIDELLCAYYSNATKTVSREHIIAALDKYVLEFSHNKNGYPAVEQFVNQSLNNIMQSLRDELPSLSEREYMLLCLIYADFSANAICMFMGYDRNKLYKQKSRLKTLIRESNCTSKDFFLRYL